MRSGPDIEDVSRAIEWKMEFGKPHEMTSTPQPGVELKIERRKRPGRGWTGGFVVDGETVGWGKGFKDYEEAQRGTELMYQRWAKKHKERT